MQNNKLTRMYFVSFLFTLHIALSAYVNSTFLAQIIPEKYVGFLYTVSYFLALILLSKSSSILKHFGNKKLILWLLLINMLSLVGLITSSDPYIIGTSFIIFTSTNSLIFLCLDIFIEHFEGNKNTGKIRGIYLTVINVAWMLSPLITSFLITKEGGYKAIYIISFIATIIMTTGLIVSVKTFKDSVYKKIPFLDSYKFLKTNSHIASIVTINFLLQFFYAWMVVYTPMYLHNHIGLGWDKIGIIFTIMLAPFVLFSLPNGILIDKYHVSRKKILYVGFSIITISTFIISFTTTRNIYLWGLILFLTRTGASLIESTSEIYFFSNINETDAYLVGLFRDMTPVAYIIAPLLATTLFMYMPFKYLFAVLAIILLVGLYYIPKLKHNNGIISENK